MSSESPQIGLQRGSVSAVLIVAIALLAAALIAAAVIYFQARGELESSKARVATLQAELASAKGDLSKEAARAEALKRDLDAAHAEVQALRAASSNARERNPSKARPGKGAAGPVPVRVAFERPGRGRGLVGIFSNDSSRVLPVDVDIHRPRNGRRGHLSLRLAPRSRNEVGRPEGWQFARGDQVTVRSSGHEAMHLVVP